MSCFKRAIVARLQRWRPEICGSYVCSTKRALALLLMAIAIGSTPQPTCFAELVTYHIGNSLTAQLLGPNWTTRLTALSQAEGVNAIQNQVDVRANQTLTHFVNVPVPAGSTAIHYGTVFAGTKLDALFLQPWYGATIRQEAIAAVELVRQMRLNSDNATTRVLIYATWGSHSQAEPFVDAWGRTDLTLDSPFLPSAMAIDLFLQEVRKTVPTVELIPAGRVFYEIGLRLRNGLAVPGIPTFENLYTDSVHPTNAGAYAACLASYAVLYGKSPVGLGYPEQMLDTNWGYVLPEEGRLPLQTLVADVVAVPEPATAICLGIGFVAIGSAWLQTHWSRRRRYKPTQNRVTANSVARMNHVTNSLI